MRSILLTLSMSMVCAHVARAESRLPEIQIKVAPADVEVTPTGLRDIASQVHIAITKAGGEVLRYSYLTYGVFCKSKCRSAAYRDVLHLAQLKCKYVIIDGRQDLDSLFAIGDEDLPNCQPQLY